MYRKRFPALLLAVAAGGLGVVTATVPAAAAQQCVSDDTAVAAVPAAQRMMTPDRVWPLSTGTGQRVAVIGTGVADNPLLEGQIAERTSLVPDADDRADCLGFGTGAAGIVAARPSSAVGFHGMAPGAQVLPVRVVGDERAESVSPDVLAAAIDWAVEHRAGVVAVTTIAHQDSEALRQSVRRALAGDVVVVASTGDLGQNTADVTPYPAAYDGVLGVGAVGPDGTVARFSRQRHVGLVAPGVDLVTTYPRNGLGPAAGTAFATAYVAGTAALVRAYRPELSSSDTVRRLLATATPAPGGTGSAAYGHGIVNPYEAVVAEVSASGPRVVPGPATTTVGAAERERLAEQARSDRLAYVLAGSGAAAALLLAAAGVLGARGRRRRWRTGFAPAPEDRPEDDRPQPPVELFADRRS